MIKKLLLPVFIGLLSSAFSQEAPLDLSYRDAIRIEKGEVSKANLLKELQENHIITDNSGTTGAGGFSVQSSSPAANDECNSAIALTLNDAGFSFSTAGATVNSADPIPTGWGSCGSSGTNKYKTVWFKFTVSGTKNIAVSSEGSVSNSSVYKAKYAVFSGSCGALTQIGTSVTGDYGNTNSKRIELSNLAAGTYYIMASGPCDETGTYKLRVEEAPSQLTSLWYPSATLPQLTAGTPYVAPGQWGTYAADGAEASTSCESGLQFSDWYKFTYETAATGGLHIVDHTSQAGFILVLYDASGNEISCNKYSQTEKYASFTWDKSPQVGIAMHMPNISLGELGLTEGATYFVRVSHNLPTRYNTNNKGKTYTVQVGNYAPAADTDVNGVTLTLSNSSLNWLNGQSNLRAGHSSIAEAEGAASGRKMENSLIYKFNSNAATMVDINLRNITYYSYSGLSGSISVQTSPTGGTSLKNAFFSASTYTASVDGLTPYTDYWIVIDGAGSYAGCQLTFDIAVSTLTPLPVKLLAFDAEYINQAVDVTWATAAEINNDYFTIERTADGEHYEAVGTVDGAGNSNAKLTYSFTDENPMGGISYYRLKQTDFDGKTEYFDPVKVLVPEERAEVKVYPNPATDYVTVEFSSTEAGEAELMVFDATGRVVYSRFVAEQELNRVVIQCTQWPDGIYYLSLNGKSLKHKLVKI